MSFFSTKETLLTSRNAFLSFFELYKRKSNLVLGPNFFSGLIKLYSDNSLINFFFNAS